MNIQVSIHQNFSFVFAEINILLPLRETEAEGRKGGGGQGKVMSKVNFVLFVFSCLSGYNV